LIEGSVAVGVEAQAAATMHMASIIIRFSII